MQKICIDENRNLIVEFSPTDDFGIDFEIELFLNEAGLQKKENIFVYTNSDIVEFKKCVKYVVDKFLEQFGNDDVEICEPVKEFLDEITSDADRYTQSLSLGREIKNKSEHSPNVPSTFTRSLMDYQKESVEHMMSVGNAANFSVPGSGKTTITYAALSRWLEDKTIEKILVICPTAAFLPWEEEYNSCFSKPPRSCRISGHFSGRFHELGDSFDIFLVHFNTAMNRQWELQEFMKKWKTALIIDESHYIKSPKLRKWASTAIIIAPYATRRIILSGTPMPNNAKDLWTQITFLWPDNSPLGNQVIYNNYVSKQGIGKYKPILDSLFCRIKKSDLNLPAPEWVQYEVELNSRQRDIYDVIAAKTLKEVNETNIRDQARLQKFRIAKMVRLLQSASNPTLLYEMSSAFDVNSESFSEQFGIPSPHVKLGEIEETTFEKIKNYSTYEIPSKMVKASEIAQELFSKGNKVIIWNSFIHNMELFRSNLLKNLKPIVINGTTPKESTQPENRDELITKFKNSSEPQILIASAASLGESVSLHKNSKGQHVCNHSIYLDRNFNGAQYMQSMDRIHRIGMDESVQVKYHIIFAKNTIDEVINRRLDEKWTDMLNALNDDMLDALDIDPMPERLNADEFNQDYQNVIAYLRKQYDA